MRDSSGNLFGTTDRGGANDDGTVFEMANGSTTITTLSSFNSVDGTDPEGGLVMDESGNLYGTTYSGGADGDGTVFEVAQGTAMITSLASFNGANGANPSASLILDSADNLYGTTSAGSGNAADGTAFEVARGITAITTLADFNVIDGAHPSARLVYGPGGNLYGATFRGWPW